MKKIFISIVCFLLLANSCLAETVIFNTKTHKFHQIGCRYAIKCTVNCIKIERKEAIKRGGIPCKVCGG